MTFATNPRDGVRVYAEDDGGGGRPVVILGGFLDQIELVRTTSMARALTDLSDELRPIYVDHRGHGRSGAPHDPAAYEMSLRAADVVAVLDELAIDRADLVGLSWGGRLCFGVAAYAPGRVRSFVSIGQQPYAIDAEGPLARLVGEACHGMTDSVEPLVEAFESVAGRYPEGVRRRYLEADPLAIRAAWAAVMAEGDVADDLTSWTIPCLICVAEDDADFAEQARRAAGEIPMATFVTIPRTDHLGTDTAPMGPVMAPLLRLLRASA